MTPFEFGYLFSKHAEYSKPTWAYRLNRATGRLEDHGILNNWLGAQEKVHQFQEAIKKLPLDDVPFTPAHETLQNDLPQARPLPRTAVPQQKSLPPQAVLPQHNEPPISYPMEISPDQNILLPSTRKRIDEMIRNELPLHSTSPPKPAQVPAKLPDLTPDWSVPLTALLGAGGGFATAPAGHGLLGGIQGAAYGGLGSLGASTGAKLVDPNAHFLLKILGGAGGLATGLGAARLLTGEPVHTKAKQKQKSRGSDKSTETRTRRRRSR